VIVVYEVCGDLIVDFGLVLVIDIFFEGLSGELRVVLFIYIYFDYVLVIGVFVWWWFSLCVYVSEVGALYMVELKKFLESVGCFYGSENMDWFWGEVLLGFSLGFC